jgi:Plasmid pRiA4b ORF-3-like protein
MAVYRFRVTLEDNEDVYREIEIKSLQHFEDFHNIIIQSIGFDNLHNASFYISDDYWRKGDEITLHPLSAEEIEQRKRKELPAKRQMNKSKMASLIDDPHQKFVYVYDPKNSWTFLIELIKILLDDVKGTFPKCVKTVGDAPKQHKSETVLPPVDDDDDFDDEDEHHKDDEAYGHNEDETALLESEEGEEEETEEQEEEQDEDGSEFEGGEEHGDDF